MDLETSDSELEKIPLGVLGGKAKFKSKWKGRELESMDIENSSVFYRNGS